MCKHLFKNRHYLLTLKKGYIYEYTIHKMSFNLNESQTYINIKLTDLGRRQMSLGRLLFKKAVISDREIDYNIDRTGIYSIENNRILSPFDSHPEIEPVNLDGSAPIQLTSDHITAAKIFTTGTTGLQGFFTASTMSNPTWMLNSATTISYTNIAYVGQSWGQNELIYTGNYPQVGELIFMPWLAPQYPVNAIPASFPLLPQNTPFVGLFYKVISANTGTITVDRPIPRFSNVAHSIAAIRFPFNGPESYYGSGTTQNSAIWNLNIVRTKDIAGTNSSQQGISGYTHYGSLGFSGTKRYFGFDDQTPAAGFIHYTNNVSGQTYGEQFIEKTVKVHAPMIQWHNVPYANGQGLIYGKTFYDFYGSTNYDPIAKTSYRYLMDSTTGGTIVGRVYHKLKIIVITDQELLNAFSYKSNRNYTYPKPDVSLTSNPKSPQQYTQVTGLCKSDYTYFVTYLPESSSYSSGTSYGLPHAIHCGYIQKISGANDINGNPSFLKISFPPNGFPFMRSTANLAGGTGWNANSVQILISEQPTANNYEIGNVPADSWKRIPGNGLVTATDLGTNTLDPDGLNNFTFVITQDDFNSGTTYSLSSGMTQNQDALNFGDESFFFGSIEVETLKAKYTSCITLWMDEERLINSLNPSYNQVQDDGVFISEVAILDEFDQVVAVGKPTYPIAKPSGEVFVFQLIIDF